MRTTALTLLMPLLLPACDPAQPPAVPDEPVEPAVAQAMPATELIPRELLFGNPTRASVQVSPDGEHISYLAPVDGVLNVWVGPLGEPDAAKPVTDDQVRGVRKYWWTWSGDDVMYIQDKEGDENWHVYQVTLDSGETRDLTPLEGVQARLIETSPDHPDAMLLGLNDRDPQYHDVYELDLDSGERTLVYQNEEYAGFVADSELQLRLAIKMNETGGDDYFAAKHEGDAITWEPFMSVAKADSLTTGPWLISRDGSSVFMSDSRDRDTAAAASLDLATQQATVLAANDKADVADAMLHPTEYTVQAVAFTYERKEWTVLDDSIAGDLEKLAGVADGEVEVTDRTLDDQTWIVAYIMDTGPVRYYRYDRPSGEATYLFSHRPELEDLALAPMHPVLIPTRDDNTLVSYLTLPLASDEDADGVPSGPVPLMLWVHGGPWYRDSWGFNSVHQWFANRGYAVLSVNFRGSTGFGKSFVNAADGEWGGKMHDDLLDAVSWAVEQGITTEEAVAIGGGSYGGYATLWGITDTPDTFACGVDIVGPSSLVTLIESIPPYWAPVLQMFTTRVGDPSTDEGRAFLESRSPITKVDAIERPLLIGQGANDPRVKQGESDRIVAAMQAKDIPVSYVLYPDEGHGFARPENRLSFFAVTEAFLSTCLGGAYEPIGDDFEGSSIQVPTGAEAVPGLAEALPEPAADEAPADEEPADAEPSGDAEPTE